MMTSLSATVADQAARIAALEANGAAQAARIATLEATQNPIPAPTAAPVATPTASPIPSVLCLDVHHFNIESDAQLAQSAPYLRTCERMAGDLIIGFNWRMGRGVSNGTLPRSFRTCGSCPVA